MKLIFHAESARVSMHSLRRRPGLGDEGRALPERSFTSYESLEGIGERPAAAQERSGSS